MADTTNKYVQKINDYLIRDAEAHSRIDTLETADKQNVKLTGDQTIGGNKTYTGDNIYEGRFVVKDSFAIQNTEGSKMVQLTQGEGDGTANYLEVPFKSGTLATTADIDSSIATNVTNKLGKASGIAQLDSTGKVPTSQLPSFVDDVIEGYYNSENGVFYKTNSFTSSNVIDAEAGKIYVDLATGKTYRWGGSAYAEISASLAIGTTEGTAYDGKAGNDLAVKVNSAISEYTDGDTGETIYVVDKAGLADYATNAGNASYATEAGKVSNSISFDVASKGIIVFDGSNSENSNKTIGSTNYPIGHADYAYHAVTKAVGTNDTTIATTAFVATAASNAKATMTYNKTTGVLTFSNINANEIN